MPDLSRVLLEAIIRGVQDWGDEIYNRSQRYVPVDRGTLKKSGVIRYLPDGFSISYRTPYAAVMEFGSRAHTEMVGRHIVMRHPVRTHARRLRRGRQRAQIIWVKAHIVNTHMRGPFSRSVRERAGRYYLSRAYEETLPKLSQYLRRHVSRVTGPVRLA